RPERILFGLAPTNRRFLPFAGQWAGRRNPVPQPTRKKAKYPPGWRPARANSARQGRMKTVLALTRAWATDSMFRPSNSKKTKNQKHVTTPLISLRLPVDCPATEHTSSPLHRRSLVLVDGGIDFGGRYSN